MKFRSLPGRLLWPALLAAAAGMALPGVASADTGTGTVETIVVRPLSFFNSDGLEFGALIPSAAAGTVTIAPDGTRTSTNVTTVGGGHHASQFWGMGTFNQIVNISMAATPINITRVGGTQTMQVRTFVIGSTPTTQVLTTAPRSFRIGSASGIYAFAVGAQLVVGANQAAGDYTGNFVVVLNYQ